jgi:two-component system chemotaxis response regulator CheY
MARILVADDDPLTCEWLSILLRREGYEVILCRNGEEALAHLRHDPQPNLILLDMMMPVMDGWTFLRQRPQPSPPVVIVTGANLNREWAEAHGCQGFVHKPVEPSTLLTEVKRCLK